MKVLLPARFARVLLGAALIAITTLALIPQQEVPITTFWDKADHAVAFLVLGLLAQAAFTGSRYMTVVAPWLIGYGAAIELAQMLTPTRVGSVEDVIADIAGLLLAGAWVGLRRRSSASSNKSESSEQPG